MFAAIRKLVTRIHANYFAPISYAQWEDAHPQEARQEIENDWLATGDSEL